MDVPEAVISSLRLAYSMLPEQESTSEKRMEIYDSVPGQGTSSTPEIGEKSIYSYGTVRSTMMRS